MMQVPVTLVDFLKNAVEFAPETALETLRMVFGLEEIPETDDLRQSFLEGWRDDFESEEDALMKREGATAAVMRGMAEETASNVLLDAAAYDAWWKSNKREGDE